MLDFFLGGAVLFIFLVLGRGGATSAIKESKAKYAVAAWMEELARHPVAFKAAGAADLARDRADVLTREFLVARGKHFRVVLRQLAGGLGLQVVVASGLLGVGGWLVISRQLTLGQLVAAELIVAATVAALAKSSKLLESWYDMLAALDKLGQLTDLPLEPQGEKTTGLPEGPLSVTVPVGGGTARITPGQHVALTGPPHGGKTTLLEAMFGVADADVAIGRVPIQDLDKTLLRRRVALVQGAEVIEGTVLENLRFGRPGPSRAEAWSLLRRVGLEETVLSLDGGLDAPLAPTGSPLVPPEVRRLIIARGLAGDPDLLLVDEAIDGLDDANRDLVLDAVFHYARSWTLVVVTHDPAVLERCDRVLTIDDSATGEV